MAHSLTNLELAFDLIASGCSADEYERRIALIRLNRCWYCGRPLNEHAPQTHLTFPTWDHVTPLTRGGCDALINKVRACLACNRDKGYLTLEEYRARFGRDHRFWGERWRPNGR